MSTTAIVGAGSGLAKTFGSHGFSVALVSRTQEKLDRLADQLTSTGIDAAGFAADVMDPGSVATTFDRIKDRFATIDVLEYSPAPHTPVPGLENPDPREATAHNWDVHAARDGAEHPYVSQ